MASVHFLLSPAVFMVQRRIKQTISIMILMREEGMDTEIESKLNSKKELHRLQGPFSTNTMSLRAGTLLGPSLIIV